VLNETMSASQQTLALQGSSPDCEWFLNGEKLPEPLVPLQRGKWSLSAKAGGESAVANFVVE
jgi:hypothetical protein